MTDLPPALTDAPVSSLYIHHILEEADRPLTTPELAERTGMSERTTRRAVERLRDRDVIETQPAVRTPKTPRHRLVADGE